MLLHLVSIAIQSAKHVKLYYAYWPPSNLSTIILILTPHQNLKMVCIIHNRYINYDKTVYTVPLG